MQGSGKGKGTVHTRTGTAGPEGNWRYRSALSLTWVHMQG